MNDIIPFQRDPHDRTLKLLPWLVSGRLDAEEQAEVEAHLETCPDCRDELEAERALGRQVAGLSFDVERGWERLRGRIEAADPGGARCH